MVATNFEETMVIAEFLRRAGELVVVAVENAESGLMLKLQDSMSVMLFKLAEALAKAFVCVKVPDQATIINYLTTSEWSGSRQVFRVWRGRTDVVLWLALSLSRLQQCEERRRADVLRLRRPFLP